jgi:hypothetical protein
MQLRRLTPSFQGAPAAAHADPPPQTDPEAAAAALDFLRGQPWPPDTGLREPTVDQAAADIRRWYGQFLARDPYQRPEGHDVPDE